jgi:hypothetical protein
MLYSSYRIISLELTTRRATEDEGATTNLARRVHNLGVEVLALESNCLAERVLNGRVVAIDKVPIHELNCERRLACQSNEVRANQRSAVRTK